MSQFVLKWSPADTPPGMTLGEAEQSREFSHLGSAVTWARRKIRRGEVMFDRVEITIVRSSTPGGFPVPDVCYDIVEEGVQRWSTSELEPTEKRIARLRFDEW